MFVFVACGLTGCDDAKYKLLWSPDGQSLAVIAGDGLHIWTADKDLSPSLIPNVQAILWLPDSHSAVVATSKWFETWQELLEVAGTKKRQQDILSSADKLRGPLIEYHGDWDKIEKRYPELSNLPELTAAVDYLALHDAEKLKSLGTKWKDLDFMPVETVLQIYRLEQGHVASSNILMRKIGEIAEMRLSPDGQYMMYVDTERVPSVCSSTYNISIVSTAGGANQLVVEDTAEHPDWTPDSHCVVYVQRHDDSVSSQRLEFGSIIRRPIRRKDGSLLPIVDDRTAGATTGNELVSLAEVPFSTSERIRCLKNNCVLLSCDELRLPARYDDPRSDNLFVVGPDSPIKPTLTAANRSFLGKTVSRFELNPASTIAAIETDDGNIALLNLESGLLKTLQHDSFSAIKEVGVMPCWRSNDEITFVTGPGKKGCKTEVVLWTVTTGTPKIISAYWPKKILESLPR